MPVCRASSSIVIRSEVTGATEEARSYTGSCFIFL
jgi:hypothetical protein